MRTVILDNGHGGIINGVYQTKGKRSPIWPDGRQLFEGEFNRSIVYRLKLLLNKADIPHVDLVPELTDVSLEERVKRANAIYKDDKSAFLLSIHGNAGGGTGFEVFTTPGETKSDELATILFNSYKKEFPELKARVDLSDKDPDKEAPFYIIKNTHCPAVLIECAFMDTLIPDCELLMDEDGRDRIAEAIYEGLVEICF